MNEVIFMKSDKVEFFGIYLGRDASALLKQNDRYQVHSVFNEVINLQDSGDQLLSVALLRKGKAWYFLNVVPQIPFLQLGIEPGQVWFNDGQKLMSEKCIVHYRDVSLWYYPEYREGLAAIKQALGKLEAYLKQRKLPEVMEDLLTIVHKNIHDPVALFSSILGWGPGLTPLGDDFLTGWMFVVSKFAPDTSRYLYSEVKVLIEKSTHLISRQQLHAAFAGKGHEYLEQFLCEMINPANRDEALQDRLLHIGATSGAGMIEGIYYGLRYLERSRVNENNIG